jgi:hypothetical protein
VDSPSRGVISQCLGFWFLNPSACQVCLYCHIIVEIDGQTECKARIGYDMINYAMQNIPDMH